MGDGLSDEGLLEALRQGDEAALAVLLERHAPSVLRFGVRMCRDEADAHDVLQETLLAAARNLRDFRGGSSLSTWFYTVARSFCIKKRRTSKFAPNATLSLDEGDGEHAARAVFDDAPSPDEHVARRELGEALETAIRALETSHREVLLLRDVEGLSANEVAQVLGVSVEAVKSRLHRARVAVRERLAPHFVPERPSSAPPAREPDAPLAPACQNVAERFSRYLEHEISPAECESMQKHVSGCARCSAACDSLKRVLLLCRASATAQVPTDVQRQLREAIREVLGRVSLPDAR